MGRRAESPIVVSRSVSRTQQLPWLFMRTWGPVTYLPTITIPCSARPPVAPATRIGRPAHQRAACETPCRRAASPPSMETPPKSLPKLLGRQKPTEAAASGEPETCRCEQGHCGQNALAGTAHRSKGQGRHGQLEPPAAAAAV